MTSRAQRKHARRSYTPSPVTHHQAPPPNPNRTVGKCRNCSRNVIAHEGTFTWGRWQHHDCAASIERMDANNKRRGRPMAQHPDRSGADPDTLGTVTVIDTNTGEVRHEHALTPALVNRAIANAARRARVWDEQHATRNGGGHHY